jgi:hypothetical protein
VAGWEAANNAKGEKKKFNHRFSQIDEEVKSWNPTTRGKKQGDN